MKKKMVLKSKKYEEGNSSVKKPYKAGDAAKQSSIINDTSKGSGNKGYGGEAGAIPNKKLDLYVKKYPDGTKEVKGSGNKGYGVDFQQPNVSETNILNRFIATEGGSEKDPSRIDANIKRVQSLSDVDKQSVYDRTRKFTSDPSFKMSSIGLKDNVDYGEVPNVKHDAYMAKEKQDAAKLAEATRKKKEDKEVAEVAASNVIKRQGDASNIIIAGEAAGKDMSEFNEFKKKGAKKMKLYKKGTKKC